MIAENYLKIEKQREKLVASYQSLPELDRSIVQLFSVIYTPITRTTCLDCLIQADLWGDKPWQMATLKPYLERLLGHNLLLPHVKNTLQIHPLIAEIATREYMRKYVREIELAEDWKKGIAMDMIHFAQRLLPDIEGPQIGNPGVQHRPAIAIIDQIDVHMIELERQRQPEPSDTRRDIDHFAGLRRYGSGENEAGGLRGCRHLATLRGTLHCGKRGGRA